jgi:hypothetical protein
MNDLAATRSKLRTPRAAAVAGLIFSVLLLVALVLLHMFVPPDPRETGPWLRTSSSAVTLALNLVPFAGVAFIWFIGVIRDRLGAREDRFFATVFLGSGLLFLAMLFVSSALGYAMVMASEVVPGQFADSATFYFARAAAYTVVNAYMVKMAVVFMISLSTVEIATGIASRSLALLGYAMALVLLIGSYFVTWIVVIFPIWVSLISTYILIDNYKHPARHQRLNRGKA